MVSPVSNFAVVSPRKPQLHALRNNNVLNFGAACPNTKDKKIDNVGITLSPQQIMQNMQEMLQRCAKDLGLKFQSAPGVPLLMALTKAVIDAAKKDELTGLFNRRCFNVELSKGFNNAVRGSSGFAVVALDMDYFKSQNDLLGHQHGDKVLKIIGGILKKVTEQKELKGKTAVFRYGGEEFALILNGIDTIEARKILIKINNAVKKNPELQKLKSAYIEKCEYKINELSQKIEDGLDGIAYDPKNPPPLRDRTLSLTELEALAKAGDRKIRAEDMKDYNTYQTWLEHVNKNSKNSKNSGFTISSGIVSIDTLKNLHEENPESFFKKADMALEAAKNGGRNNVGIYSYKTDENKTTEGKYPLLIRRNGMLEECPFKHVLV